MTYLHFVAVALLAACATPAAAEPMQLGDYIDNVMLVDQYDSADDDDQPRDIERPHPQGRPRRGTGRPAAPPRMKSRCFMITSSARD